MSAAKADTGSGAGALEAEAWEQWAKPVVDALEGWLDEGMEPGRIRSRLQETAPDTDALAAAFSAVPGSGLGADAAVRKGEKVAAAHCNQYGHKPGCSRGNGVDKRRAREGETQEQAASEGAGQKRQVLSRLPAQSPADRAAMTAAMEADGVSDYNIYREQSKYNLDEATMKDVVDFKRRRKEKVRELRRRFQGTKVRRNDENLPCLIITKQGIKEMTDDKPLDKSVRLGCSVSEFEEALNNMNKLLRNGGVTTVRKGGQGRHANNDNVSIIATLECSYVSHVSGEKCKAVFSIHEPKDTLPFAYFMYTKKERPKQ